jgi:NADH-quinone oxidoreductase subunit G
MPKLKVNGNEVEFEKGMTVLQACELAGEEIPRFCYHERLKIAGNCRMCLVQVEGGPPKPAASCAMPAVENMVVHTNTPMVKKAREGVMEFLLINHPLDCPICDQGGECDLQDQAMAYGKGTSRYREDKRAVKEKYMGPLIGTQMTRCIQCTRCIRFLEDVAGLAELGAVGRGEHMEVTTYVEQSLHSELSGNIIDLCPVGALTSKPYAYKARSWELRKTESIDVLDAVGSNIRVDVRGREVMRILPRLNEDINEEWISDKTRFAYDGLNLQRLDRPYVRKNGKLVPASWEEAYQAIAAKIKSVGTGAKIAALAGDLVDCESVYVLKDLLTQLETPNIDCRQDGAKLDPQVRASYLFNTTIAGIEQADVCLLIGTNPKIEAPILNSRLRKVQLRNQLSLALVGEKENLTYPYEYLGDTVDVLQQLVDGTHPYSNVLQSAKKPMLILGMALLRRKDGSALLELAKQLADRYNMIQDGFNGFNVLHQAAGRVGALDLGFVPGKKGKAMDEIMAGCAKGTIEVLYLLGADEIATDKLGDTFVIYQGHHGDKGAHRADVILPGCAYTEKNATYVNTEGRVQRAYQATTPPGNAKEDWCIIAELASSLGYELGYQDIKAVRAAMEKAVPHFANTDQVVPAVWKAFGKAGALASSRITQGAGNFYMTDVISRASTTMAKCTQDILGRDESNQEVA